VQSVNKALRRIGVMPQVIPPPPKPGKNLTIFDQVERAKQQGIETAYQYANLDWKNIASKAVTKCAMELPEFSTNEVWEEINKTGVTTHTNRALGAIMQAAARSGMIKKVGYVGSKLAHASPVTLWQSNIYKPKSRQG
jgi:hypothetical protein